MQSEVRCRGSEPNPRNAGGEQVGETMPEIPLRHPGFLGSLVTSAPISLAVMFGLAFYFRPAVIFAVIAWPVFTVWSGGLWIWARRRELTGDQHTDTGILHEVTIKTYLYIQVVTVLASIACLLLGLGILSHGGAIGAIGYVIIVVLYGLAVAASFCLPSSLMRLEIDTAREQPSGRAAKFLKGANRIPTTPGALAGLAVALAVVAREALAQVWFAALAGGLALVPAFGLILLLMTGFRKWQYLRRLREAEFGGKD